jgi:galactokinase
MNSWHDRLIQSGMTAEQANAKQLLLQKCFAALGTENVASVVYAPGRVEFLGKHTDYCGGRSLLCTVDRGLIVAATRGESNTIRITETSSGESVEFAGTTDLQPRDDHWSNYPMTVVRRLAQNFGELRGARIAIASDLPRAAGLSSSSALVVALFLLFSKLNNLPSQPSYSSNIRTLEDLSGYLGCVENGQNFKNLPGDRGVGTFGGSQDHTAILCSQPDALVQYRFAPVVHERTIPFPNDYTLAIGVSGVVAEKTGAAKEKYNQISLRAAEILRRWNSAKGRDDPTLAAASISLESSNQIFSLLADKPQLRKRFQQFLLESKDIVPTAGDALLAGNLRKLRKRVAVSQSAAERWLHNQVAETIFFASQAIKLGAIAASAFGAGFGGSAWAMVRADIADQFLTNWKHAYVTQFPQHSERCEFFSSRPCIPATTLL